MMLFQPGALIVTERAAAALGVVESVAMIRRHLTGDWSELDPEDRRANREAARDGDTVLSEFTSASGARIWILTAADRSYTRVHLPEEY